MCNEELPSHLVVAQRRELKHYPAALGSAIETLADEILDALLEALADGIVPSEAAFFTGETAAMKKSSAGASGKTRQQPALQDTP